MSVAARAAFAAVRGYQRVTANRPSPCRYIPTCSNYALDAYEHHGFVRGTWLTARRISRCHPWGGHGWDPVPGVGDAHHHAGAPADAGTPAGSPPAPRATAPTPPDDSRSVPPPVAPPSSHLEGPQ
jgi:putative membrane protein insertion efficiency factor